MLVADQEVGDAVTVPNFTVPEPPKLVPLIVTLWPTPADVGENEVMAGLTFGIAMRESKLPPAVPSSESSTAKLVVEFPVVMFAPTQT
jgi:hypothetical protein